MKTQMTKLGITQYRWERLLNHMRELKRLSNGHIRTTPDSPNCMFGVRSCPICCFMSRRHVEDVDYDGSVILKSGEETQVYTHKDYLWWRDDPTPQTRLRVIKELQRMIKSGEL